MTDAYIAYKKLDEFPKNIFNIHNHSGYLPKELYIMPKYKTFKKEISEYKYFDHKNYPGLITKVKKYMETVMAKKMSAILATGSHAIKLQYKTSI